MHKPLNVNIKLISSPALKTSLSDMISELVNISAEDKNHPYKPEEGGSDTSAIKVYNS